MQKLSRVIGFLLITALIMSLCPLSIAAHAETAEKLAAFPGAEGGGMWTTGARGGGSPSVYRVTSLADDGSYGTLRDAVSQPNRIIVFDVAGNIELSEPLKITSDNLTILGQTAPGDGVCVKDYNTDIQGNNIIIRYMRFRMGDKNNVEADTLGGRNIHDVIIDHCSASWSVDECVSFYDNKNFTLQWCIIAESLKHSVHVKGSHGYGGVWGGENASFHHNLLAHHDSRNPRTPQGNFEGDDYDMTKQVDLSDLRNNVIYNWGQTNSAYGGQAAMAVNIINCYYKYGPGTKDSIKGKIYELSSSANNKIYAWSSDLYLDGNYVDGFTNVTANNAEGVYKDKNAGSYYVWTKDKEDTNGNGVEYKTLTEEAKSVHFKYENDYPVTTESAEAAYKSVLESAGASLSRDSADERVINDVRNRTGKEIHYSGQDAEGNQITDTTYGIINSPDDVGGYPALSGKAAKDSDNDGIPNEWEDKNGLNKYDSSDSVKIAESGYTYAEEYANDLADGSFVRNYDYDPDAPQLDDLPDASIMIKTNTIYKTSDFGANKPYTAENWKLDTYASNYESLGKPFGELSKFPAEYTNYCDNIDGTLSFYVKTPGEYTVKLLLREYKERGYKVKFNKDGAENQVVDLTKTQTKIAEYNTNNTGSPSYINIGVAQGAVNLESGLYTITFESVNGTYLTAFRIDGADNSFGGEEPVSFGKGDSEGGYYTENDLAASDSNPKYGIIRFFQEYAQGSDVTEYGFYFVNGDTGAILDKQHYIKSEKGFDENGFYGDLTGITDFNTDYYAMAYVKIGELTYTSGIIPGKADDTNWVKKPVESE